MRRMALHWSKLLHSFSSSSFFDKTSLNYRTTFHFILRYFYFKVCWSELDPTQAMNTCLCYWSLMLISLEACNQSIVFHSQTLPPLVPCPSHVPSCICQQPAELVSHSCASLHSNCRFDLWCPLWFHPCGMILASQILIVWFKENLCETAQHIA